MKKGNYNTFHEERKYLIKNPPKGVTPNTWK